MLNNYPKRILYKVARELAGYLHRKIAFFPSDEKVISFTFDDFPVTAIENGANIMKSNGVYGTFYTSLGLAEKNSLVGKIGTISEMLKLHQEGHEVGCHTFTHLECIFKSSQTINIDCKRNKAIAHEVGGISFQSFAYPFGRYDPISKYVVSNLYSTARTIEPGINVSKIDLASLKSINLGDDYSQWIDRLDRSSGWLIFHTHDICKSPSKYGCSIKLFKKVLGLSLKKGFKILPINKTIKLCHNL